MRGGTNGHEFGMISSSSTMMWKCSSLGWDEHLVRMHVMVGTKPGPWLTFKLQFQLTAVAPATSGATTNAARDAGTCTSKVRVLLDGWQ